MMAYLKREEERFAEAKAPKWKRIAIKDKLFPEVSEFKAITIHNNDNIELQNLLSVIQDEKIVEYLDIDYKHERLLDDAFKAYINYNFNHGLYINVKEDSSQPLEINYMLSVENPLLVDHHLIVVEEGVNAKIIIDYNSVQSGEFRHYGSLKVIAKQGARVNISKIQRLNDESYHYDMVITEVAEGASVIYNDAEIGAKFKASSSAQTLLGLRADGQTYEAYYGQRNSSNDFSHLIKHSAEKTTSAILAKGALAENAKKVFRGNLYFDRGSSQSVGKEEEFVVLLSEKLRSDSIPGLFAEEDDVIGEHAASVGQVDADKMFYIMSRGFSETEAKKLIIRSGYEEVLEKMQIDTHKNIIKEALEQRID